VTLLATLYPAYVAGEFDLEVAQDSPKRLVLSWEQAVKWVSEEITEGRAVEWDEWEYEEFRVGKQRIATWKLECNEYGSAEEWILCVEDVPLFQPTEHAE